MNWTLGTHMTTSQFARGVILTKTDEIIPEAAADIIILFLEKKKKKTYTITRNDGWVVSFQKLRKSSRRNYPITDKDMKTVKKLLKSKKKCSEIAETLGLTKNRVADIIRKIDHFEWIPGKESIRKYSAQVIKLRKSGYSRQQISDKLHMSGKTITVILRKHQMLGERHSKRN